MLRAMRSEVQAAVCAERLDAGGRPLTGHTVKVKDTTVSLAMSEDANGKEVASLCIELGKKEPLVLLLRSFTLYNKLVGQGRLTCKFGWKGGSSTMVYLSNCAPADVAAFAAALDAAARGPIHSSIHSARPPLAPLVNGAAGSTKSKRPLGTTPGKEEQTRSRTPEGDGAPNGATASANASPAVDAPALSDAQRRAAQLVAARRNVLLTGAAGTGKSHALRHCLATSCANRVTFRTAPTGLAACELGPGALTLNAFAGIGRAETSDTEDVLLARVKASTSAVRRWRIVEVLVVDEVSMLDGRMLDALDFIGRALRRKDAPFGGIQLVLCGDFHQLPPVARDDRFQFAFEAAAWGEAKFEVVQLKDPFRQKDPSFFRILNAVRVGHLDPASLAALQERCVAARKSYTVPGAAGAAPPSDGIMATKLYTHRADVERENVLALAELQADLQSYDAVDTGPPGDASLLAARLDSACPARRRLRLRLGAQVMLVRSVAPAKGLVNGARGVVTGFSKASKLPVVRFACGIETTVAHVKWELAGISRTQLPLDLAWALSVHKSQGMSLDRVEVSLERAFAHGQAYVALSRVRSLEGLTIVGNITAEQCAAHPKVLAFYAELVE